MQSRHQIAQTAMRTAGAVLVIAALAVSGLGVAADARPLDTRQDVDPPTTADSLLERTRDLLQARANGGVSPNRVVVVYDSSPSTGDPIRQQVRQRVNAILIRAQAGLGQDVLRVPGAAAAIAQQLRSMPGVRDAYPDAVATVSLAVNDPMMGSEWGLAKIQAPTAWDTATGSDVRVAVLDCGIRASHPDLAGRVGLERNFTAAATADDRCNHGTHVAGTIGAVTNNAEGVAAVAPGVTLLNGKVLDDSGSGFFSDIDAAIQWAADNGARVANMSLGGRLACPTGTQNAVNYAWNRGTVLVAAAGNDGRSGASAPANCQNVIGVAATDANDAKASFSNYGSEVDVAAPGVNILSTVNPDLNNGSQYAYFNGTSMATPHVSGVLALIWATSYGTSAAAVRDRLFNTSDRIARTGTWWSRGRINAARAVQGGALAAAPTSTSAPTSTATPTNTAATVDTPTSTPAPTETPASTATPTNTPPPTNTPVPTNTPAPTNTPPATNTPTLTPTPVPTSTPAPSVPAAPSSLNARNRVGYISLVWHASSTPGVTYNVYRGTSSGGETLYARGVSGLSYDDRGAVRQQRYYYYVTAVNSAGESARSNEDYGRAR